VTDPGRSGAGSDLLAAMTGDQAARALLAYAPFPFALVDGGLHVLWANDAMADLAAAEADGVLPVEGLALSNDPGVVECLRQVLSGGDAYDVDVVVSPGRTSPVVRRPHPARGERLGSAGGEVPGEARLAAMLEDMPEEAGAAEVAVAVRDAAIEARGDRVADDIAILVLRAL
jgi:hypothetical protein